MKDVDRRRHRRRAAVHGGARRGRSRAQHEHRRRRAGSLLGARRRVHRRGLAGDGEGGRRRPYAIVGHSERRRLFGETDAIVNRKTLAAIAAGLTPIVCIGETLEERERGEMLGGARPADQGRPRSAHGASRSPRWSIAYEPVWAIGTGRTATAAQAGEAHAHIRKRLRQWFGGDAADAAASSTAAASSRTISASSSRKPDVDGALVGGASLDVAGLCRHRDQSRAAYCIIGVSCRR